MAMSSKPTFWPGIKNVWLASHATGGNLSVPRIKYRRCRNVQSARSSLTAGGYMRVSGGSGLWGESFHPIFSVFTAGEAA
jgi:hypothetical protein